MSYQDICKGLYKKASSEQLRKLASLIGMRKKADYNQLRNLFGKRMDPSKENKTLSQTVEDSLPSEEPLALNRLGRGVGAYGVHALMKNREDALAENLERDYRSGLASWQPKYMPSAEVIKEPLSPAQQTKNKIRSLVGTLYRPFYSVVRSVGPVVQKGLQNAVKQSRIPSPAK